MFINEAFELENESSIRSIKPMFGWPESGFGEYIYYRHYSRTIRDEYGIAIGQENWHDTCIRVINGLMSIRRDHYLRNRIQWDESYWQDYGTRMGIAMARMEWLPPGRGLWTMGTDAVRERGAMPLYNCFTGNTRFFTDSGLVSFNNSQGTTVNVLCKDGQCRQAKVNYHGEQQINRVCFKPKIGKSNYRIEYFVTPNHRWFLSNGTETTRLKKGDKVIVSPFEFDFKYEQYKDGFAHGFVFGDGSASYTNEWKLPLCGVKDKEYIEQLILATTYDRTNETSYKYPVLYFKTEINYKELPISKDRSYLLGFLEGVLAADGYVNKRGEIFLDNTSVELIEWIKSYSVWLGFVITGNNVNNRDTNYGRRTKPLNRLKLRREPVEFIVDYILPAGVQKVYCLEEPITHSFILEYGVPTGNCAYTDVGTDWVDDLSWIMDTLMNGVGVGFGPKRTKLELYDPRFDYHFSIPDTREGWVDATRRILLAFATGGSMPICDYSNIRPYGTPIRTFGGTASGPEPLIEFHDKITELCYRYIRDDYDEILFKTDLANLVGVCVVSGNVRRSAQIACGELNDDVFMGLKDYKSNPERAAWGWMSNNSIRLRKSMDFESLDLIAQRNVRGHDVGYINMRNLRHGRIGKFKDKERYNLRDDKAVGFNPCGEIPLEHREVCNLSETLPTRCSDFGTWLNACEYATMYCSTVTLLPTHQPTTNAVVNRNRRIGVSIIDFSGWKHQEGTSKVIRCLRRGYDRIRRINSALAKEAGIPDSIRVTTVKPGGTVPKLAGRTSGISHPTFRYTRRRVNVGNGSAVDNVLTIAGLPFEENLQTKNTHVYSFPIEQGPACPATEVSIWEQAMNVVLVQREWADNAVSNTLYFKPKWRLIRANQKIDDINVGGINDWVLAAYSYSFETIIQNNNYKVIINRPAKTYDVYQFNPHHEEDELEAVLASIAPYTKSISLLPHTEEGIFAQMPESSMTKEQYEEALKNFPKINWDDFFGSDGEDEKFCQGASCEIVKE